MGNDLRKSDYATGAASLMQQKTPGCSKPFLCLDNQTQLPNKARTHNHLSKQDYVTSAVFPTATEQHRMWQTFMWYVVFSGNSGIVSMRRGSSHTSSHFKDTQDVSCFCSVACILQTSHGCLIVSVCPSCIISLHTFSNVTLPYFVLLLLCTLFIIMLLRLTTSLYIVVFIM